MNVTTGADLYAESLPSGRDQDRVELIDRFSTAKSSNTINLLALDDLDKIKPGDYFGSLLHAIIDGRYRRGLPVLVTSNRPASELAPLLGEGVVRRLGDMTELLKM